MSIVHKRYGISKVVYEVEGLLLNGEYFKGAMFSTYVGLEERVKEQFRSEMYDLIKKYVMNENFRLALAKDSIIPIEFNEGNIVYEYNVQSHVFQYFKKTLYRGKTQALLTDLMEVLQENE